MSSPSSSPAGVPQSGGNGKYAVVAGVLVLGIVGLLAMRTCSPPHGPPPPLPTFPVSSAEPSSNPKLDDIPPPAPPDDLPDTGRPPPRVASSPGGGCEGKCVGTAPPELGQAIQIRAGQARRCYNTALAQDSTLKGHVSLTVRIGTAGNVCSATVASNDMGTPNVANCAANIFRMSAALPSPRGGCVDANVPLSFVPTGH